MASPNKEQTYKLEEMKQLRRLIGVFIQEIAKVEIFTVTAIAAVMAFKFKGHGSSAFVESVVRFGPVFLTFFLLVKAYRFAHRIRLIDDYLAVLEKEFVTKGAWVKYFREKSSCQFFIVGERIIITLVFFLISIFLAIFPPPILN